MNWTQQRRATLVESSLALRGLWLRAGKWDVVLARLSVAVLKPSIERRSRRVVRDSPGKAFGWGGVAGATTAIDVELVDVVARARGVWARWRQLRVRYRASNSVLTSDRT